ncbi:MAG: hypothetical protein U9R27_03850 [Campylobacterota bacterium]|nr:hypothetical protein [Campylobacterota bacterium]
MIKKIALAATIIALSSSLQAEGYSEGKKFIGIEGGGAQLQGGRYMDLEDPLSFDPMYKGKGPIGGLRFGAQNEKYRTMILFDYYSNDDDDQTYQMGLISIDYYVLSQDAAAVTIKPFIGINFGYMRYESTLVDEDDFVYGGQAGMVMSVSDKVDIDLTYRYNLSYEAPTMDHLGALLLGVNYLY